MLLAIREEKMETEGLIYDVDIQLAENESIEVENDQLDTNEYETKRALLKKTKIVKQTWSILEIFQKIKDGKLLLNPEYQRNVIWDKAKKTAFIESLFMGIIIPPVYVVEIPGDNILEENTYEVVDGKQRLSTIDDFIKGTLVMQEKSLEYYPDWFAGKTFSSIRQEHLEMVNEMLSSVLDIYVITANSPEFTKYDIFSRLNKGAEKLKVNEIRKAIYRSETLKLIEKYVVENIDGSQYRMVFSQNDIKRYEDYGRFYRSIAFYVRTSPEKECVEKYNSRPREMINDVLYEIQQKSIVIEPETILAIIQQTIQLLIRFKENPNRHYLIDSCIYYAVLNPQRVMGLSENIEKDPVILETLEKSPQTTSNVNKRAKRVHEMMNK